MNTWLIILLSVICTVVLECVILALLMFWTFYLTSGCKSFWEYVKNFTRGEK